MLTRADLDVRLAVLEAEIPLLRQDMDAFYGVFEQRTARLCEVAAPEDQDYVLDRLLDMIQRAGLDA